MSLWLKKVTDFKLSAAYLLSLFSGSVFPVPSFDGDGSPHEQVPEAVVR